MGGPSRVSARTRPDHLRDRGRSPQPWRGAAWGNLTGHEVVSKGGAGRLAIGVRVLVAHQRVESLTESDRSGNQARPSWCGHLEAPAWGSGNLVAPTNAPIHPTESQLRRSFHSESFWAGRFCTRAWTSSLTRVFSLRVASVRSASNCTRLRSIRLAFLINGVALRAPVLV